MHNSRLIIVAMAEECRHAISRSDEANSLLPESLRPKHLLWMCDRIEQHADDWPATRLHRWIGFVQSGMMANRILDLATAKVMFNKAKVAHADIGEDEDLVDHLDAKLDYRLELGGES